MKLKELTTQLLEKATLSKKECTNLKGGKKSSWSNHDTGDDKRR